MEMWTTRASEKHLQKSDSIRVPRIGAELKRNDIAALEDLMAELGGCEHAHLLLSRWQTEQLARTQVAMPLVRLHSHSAHPLSLSLGRWGSPCDRTVPARLENLRATHL